TRGDDDSAAEFAMAKLLAELGWNANQIYFMLQRSGIRAEDDPKRQRKSYYATTIARAMETAQEYLEQVARVKKTKAPPLKKPTKKEIKEAASSFLDEPWLKYLTKTGVAVI